jgi:hypothetical protein
MEGIAVFGLRRSYADMDLAILGYIYCQAVPVARNEESAALGGKEKADV